MQAAGWLTTVISSTVSGTRIQRPRLLPDPQSGSTGLQHRAVWPDYRQHLVIASYRLCYPKLSLEGYRYAFAKVKDSYAHPPYVVDLQMPDWVLGNDTALFHVSGCSYFYFGRKVVSSMVHHEIIRTVSTNSFPYHSFLPILHSIRSACQLSFFTPVFFPFSLNHSLCPFSC